MAVQSLGWIGPNATTSACRSRQLPDVRARTQAKPFWPSVPQRYRHGIICPRSAQGTVPLPIPGSHASNKPPAPIGKAAKTVLIEYPFDPQWKLTAPAKPEEKTRNLYRFAVEAKPGEPAKLAVEEERTDHQQVALGNLDDNTIKFYLSAKVVGEKVKEALAEIVKRKQALQEIAVKKQQCEQRISQIGEDQTRIRQNMAQLDRGSDVYKNYVKKFSDQESEIEKTRSQIASLSDQATGMQKSLDEYILGLDLQ